MAKSRNGSIPVGIFIPEALRLIAGTANIKRIGKSAQLAGRIDHDLHVAPDGFALCEDVQEGATIRMGQRLMRLP